MREESDCPAEDIMDIDLSIVKEEVLNIDDFNEYSWPEAIDQDTAIVKKDEEKSTTTFLTAVVKKDNEENIESGEGSQNTVGFQTKTKKRRKTRIDKKRKVKHWCSICHCKQESPHALALHRLQFHSNAARYRCAYCPRVFFHHSNHRKHELNHLGALPRQNCTMCTKTFARKDGLLAHIRSVHTGERPYVCQSCGMSFARDFCYRTHLNIHTGNKPYACNECTRAFFYKSDLVRHQRLHTGEKPYSCEDCPKTFRTRGHLNQHRTTHTDERPIACGLCSKMFRRGTNVTFHRRCHIVNATILKMHKCEVCHKEFSRKGNMKEHMKRHAPKKSIQCRYCSLSFKTRGDWAKHENLHTREKVYICDTCGRKFMRKGRLRNHIHALHLRPSRPTVCLACGRDYKFPSKLKIHSKNKKCSKILTQLKKNKGST